MHRQLSLCGRRTVRFDCVLTTVGSTWRPFRDAFPLPRINESLDALHGSTLFSTCDLVSGFYQIAMDPLHPHKTNFTTLFRLYEYTRMPFGLCNSPASFQRLKQHIFNDDAVFQILLVYLDDIIIYSKTWDKHVERLDAVFIRHPNMVWSWAQRSRFFSEGNDHSVSTTGV